MLVAVFDLGEWAVRAMGGGGLENVEHRESSGHLLRNTKDRLSHLGIQRHWIGHHNTQGMSDLIDQCDQGQQQSLID